MLQEWVYTSGSLNSEWIFSVKCLKSNLCLREFKKSFKKGTGGDCVENERRSFDVPLSPYSAQNSDRKRLYLTIWERESTNNHPSAESPSRPLRDFHVLFWNTKCVSKSPSINVFTCFKNSGCWRLNETTEAVGGHLTHWTQKLIYSWVRL